MIDFEKRALEYARMGWAVFPLAQGEKVPAIKGGHGCKDATTNADIIRRWARAHPGANIGVACGDLSGGIVVVDVDPRHGGDRSIAALALKGRGFPPGPSARTGNGGQHLFFRCASKLSNSAGKLGAGIDIRSTGGYVVAPPSWIKASESGPGGFYEWIVRPDGHIPRLPIWVSTLLKPREPKPYNPPKTLEEGRDRLQGLADFAARAPQGQRNSSAFWAACCAAELVALGKVSPAAAEERMRIAGRMAGLSSEEIERTVASAMRRILGGGSERKT